jgi:hypothetical protein
LALTDLDKNFMQMGGFTFARERIASGSAQSPSPHMKPDATAGPNESASALFFLSQMKSIIQPKNISIVKKDPT